ncbi:GspH/FimT family pseudopilin [Acidovorax sp. Leaf78]|uniref:GspH/FimT family pseudopilin n=1 Tax=unclassified Acidovorax TaxID=2684926 RepID=UPI001F28ADEB|nr:GspH/FimT family pseudopilin [Acidovorax sp. Leaf78]
MSGFTLIELLVVFAIIALVVGLVPVAMDRMREGAQYRDVVRTVVGQLRLAREQAVASGRDVQFTVDVAQRRYGLGPDPSLLLPDALQMKAVAAALEGDEQSTGKLSIRFLPSGGSSGGSVQILRGAGDGVRLRVDWLSGRVTQEALIP